MDEFLQQRNIKDGSYPQCYGSVTDLFPVESQDDYRDTSKITSSHRESPSTYIFNSKLPVTIPNKEQPLTISKTCASARQKQNWIFSQGYGEKVMADAGLMIRCAIPECDRLYRSVNGSTSSIRNHLKRKHGIEGPLESETVSASPVVTVAAVPQPKKPNTIPIVEPMTSLPPPRKQVTPVKPKSVYIPLENLEENKIPLEVLQDPRLLRFIGTSLPANSQVNLSVMPGNVLEDASIQVQLYKSKVRDILRRQIGVCITLGRWNNEKGLKQIVVTSHFIDNDWKPKELLLGIFNPATTTNLEHARQLFVLIEEYEFVGVLHTITTDYGSDMCIIIQELSKLCAAKNIKFVPSEQHVPCLGFIINSTLNNVLKFGISPSKNDINSPHFNNQMSINERLEKFRGGISNILGSVERLMHFQAFFMKNHTKYRELILDSANEWDSTYHMVETLLEVKQAYNDTCYCSDLNKFAISQEDTELLEEMKNFLGPFHAFSIRVSGTRYSAYQYLTQ
ncbi:hypothetical protein DSO57_1039651 [Entomophthora muscae]|uniref:Uncharacterized protein n=1 Tax=Entomophthora muscae TaxID=34485 RepID=A0ACC2S3J5_9FUNG|nr:hypothetical protein DSO57_1039651 [Entomophthora muscae]